MILVALALALTGVAARGAAVPVYNTNNGLVGSLRQAIQDANSGDTVVFQIPTTDPGYNAATGVFTIMLTSGELVVSKNLTIEGAPSKIVVQRSGAEGAANFRIFNVTAGTVSISSLTITGGGGANPGVSYGAGILNAGILTVRNCTVSGNSAFDGGGIFNEASGTLTITNSTILQNKCTSGSGGGVSNNGFLSLNNSTVVQNQVGSGGSGGGVNNAAGGTARVRNTIIAGNVDVGSTFGFDVFGAFVSDGYNFIGRVDGATGFGLSGSHDQVGNNAAPADPNLGSLQDNGGPTATMRPLSGSFVIDQGLRGLDGNNAPINIDQRGQPRPLDQAGVINAGGGDGSDIGAVEVGLLQLGPSYTVNTTDEHDDGTCTTDDCTLREATKAANTNVNANTINFANGLSGTITTDFITPTGLPITNPVTINGPGARILTVSGQFTARVFNVSGANVVISGLTIAEGYRENANGGGVYNTGGLIFTDCEFSYNVAVDVGDGGGIFNATGATLALVRCNLSINFAGQFGGAVYNDGTFTATNCTFYENLASKGGGIISRFAGGVSSATLLNCTITACTSTGAGTATGDGGGGFYAEGGAQQYHLGNTIISGNFSNANPPTNPDVRGNFTSDGHNLIGELGFSTWDFNGTSGDQIETGNAQLDTLMNNGGPTDTCALLSGSTAINAGNDALAPATDQRGYPRVRLSDIGAFEFESGNLRVTKIARVGNDVVIDFSEAVGGSSYRLERKLTLTAATWEGITDLPVTTTGPAQIIHLGGATELKAFYQVRLLP